MQQNADQNTADLPEGTDKVIEGAANSGAIETNPAVDDADDGELTIEGAGRTNLSERLKRRVQACNFRFRVPERTQSAHG